METVKQVVLEANKAIDNVEDNIEIYHEDFTLRLR